MEHFPQEILHSILRRTSVYSQNESTMVCRAWRVAARHVLSQTASKIIMRSNRLAHYALQLDSIPNFGQGISTVALSVRAAQGLDSANQFEDIVRRWPLLVNLLFHGTHPGLFVEHLLDANIALPYLEQIRVSREHIASLGHFYLELLRRYSSSLRRITIDVSASGLFDTLLVLYGNVARYVADRQVVLNTLLSSCPGLKTLELSVDPGRFLAVQDVAVPPVSHLEQLKVDAGVISLRLYAYLREFCEEVNKHFRPCTVDPGRRDPFVSYHGGTDIRRLSSIEYYNMGGSVTRMKKQQKYKQELGIEKIETDIPSPKTASVEQFVLYVAYMLQHMNTLFDF
ncbi:unnamed protein product [Mucor circinelloides]